MLSYKQLFLSFLEKLLPKKKNLFNVPKNFVTVNKFSIFYIPIYYIITLEINFPFGFGYSFSVDLFYNHKDYRIDLQIHA